MPAYNRQMRPRPLSHLCALLAAAALAGPALAVRLEAVQLRGVDGALADNARTRISLERLSAAQRAELSETRLAFLLRALPGEVQRGLEPFGYYDARVGVELQRAGDAVTVLVDIDPGVPVTVRQLALALDGPAGTDPKVLARVAQFQPREGQRLHHGVYEGSKAAVSLELAERGYFDAELERHRIEVTRADKAADIDLAWASGRRYALGPARFEGQQFRDGVLDPLVPWTPGQEFDRARLLELQASLADTDYFSGISVVPEPENALDGQVPVKVLLIPNRRSVHNLGLRYGTDSGAGVNARLERRWINNRGHKLLAEANLAQFRSDLVTEYRIPAFGWLDGWYALNASVREEQIEDQKSQYINLAAVRTGRWRGWDLHAALNFKRERFDAFDAQRLDYSTLVYPSLLGEWRQVDDPNTPRRGLGLTVELRGGASGLGSEVDFLQLRAAGRHIRGLSASNRLLLRAELGTTWAPRFTDFPPSMRWYAGGDQSVRGYGYREIGQRVDDRVLGGKHLVAGSVELEHMFSGRWGAAVFVDAGDAFDDSPDLQLGIGAGLRWRSPVGPVRVDLARGLDNPDQTVRLHVGIGPDL